MPPSEEDKQRLYRALQRFDLEDYIEANFVKSVPSGSFELRVDCFSPNGCNGDDNKAHLWVNTHKKAWICYKCGYGDPSQQKGTGWIPRFISDVEGIPLRVVIQRILDVDEPTPAEDLSDLLDEMFAENDQEDEDVDPPTMEMPKQFYALSGANGHSSKKFRKYAHDRGFDDELIERHGILYCVSPIPSLPKKYQRTFVDRLIWPLYDENEVMRSVIARDVTGSGNRPKWVNWPDTEPSFYLWPMGEYIDETWVPRVLTETVALTEGIINAYAIESMTEFSARACFGKKISDEQVGLLLRGGVKTVILAWDYDARDKMIRAVGKLNANFEVLLFPYRDDSWASNPEMDFGDAMDPDSPVHGHVENELETAVNPHSPEYIRWAIG